MSNRIDSTFARLRETNQKAFVAYVAAGDPDAVAVGDFHLKNIVVHALAGRPRGTDDRQHARHRHRPRISRSVLIRIPRGRVTCATSMRPRFRNTAAIG